MAPTNTPVPIAAPNLDLPALILESRRMEGLVITAVTVVKLESRSRFDVTYRSRVTCVHCKGQTDIEKTETSCFKPSSISVYTVIPPEYRDNNDHSLFVCPHCKKTAQTHRMLLLESNQPKLIEHSILSDLTPEVLAVSGYPKAICAQLDDEDLASVGYQLCRYLYCVSIDEETLTPMVQTGELARLYTCLVGQSPKGQKRMENGTYTSCPAASAFVKLGADYELMSFHHQNGSTALNRTGLRNYLDYCQELAQSAGRYYGFDASAYLGKFEVYERLRRAYPGVEQLSKCGYMPLIHAIITRTGRKSEYDKCAASAILHKGTNPSLILNYDKAVLKRLKEQGLFENATSAESMARIHQQCPVTIGFLSQLTAEVRLSDFYGHYRLILDLIKHGYTLQELAEYANRLWLGQALTSNETFNLLNDYRTMADVLEVEHERFPRQLRVAHDLFARSLKYKKDELMEQKFKQKHEAYQALNYQTEKDDFFMILPEKPEELVKEGHDLNHCVASYISRVANGDTLILFLRKKSDPENSFITVEWRDGHVVQANGRSNSRINNYPEALDFFKKWQKHATAVHRKGYMAA